MQTAETFDVSTLAWIKGELDETLKDARQALESFVETPEDPGQLDGCVGALHQVHRTLQMIELSAAAQFLAEVEAFARALQRGELKGANHEEPEEALMRAILELPDYLDALQNGHPDSLLPLLPLANQMRRLRGEPEWSELSIFNPDLSIRPPNRESAGNLQAIARKARPHYQIALANLLRDREVAASLQILRKVLNALFRVADETSIRQVLWVASGLVEALCENGLDASRELKHLLGKVEQLLKHLAQKGEASVNLEQVQALTRVLLYHVGRATAGGALVTGIKDAFGLDAFFPEERLSSGLTADLKKTVAADIMEELSHVKDMFDVFVRGQRAELEDLQPIGDGLSRLADTLHLLRQQDLQQALEEQVEVLGRIRLGELTPEYEVLMGVAGALLLVESTLEGWGSNGPVEKADDAGENSGDGSAEAEHLRGVRQVMKEGLGDLVRIRESLSAYLDSPGDTELVKSLPADFHRLVGSLNLLSYSRVARILKASATYVRDEILNGNAVPDTERLDRLADVVMSVEYYLEAFVQSRVHPASVLDVAEDALAALGYPVDGIPQGAAANEATEAEPCEPTRFAEDAAVEQNQLETGVATELGTATDSASQEGAADGIGPNTDAAGHSDEDDEFEDEIAAVFLEEVQEELEKIMELLPRWEASPSDKSLLTEYRRSFHTLKGSGRLVGATALGEFAWSIESMLNRVIDGIVEPGPVMFDLLFRAEKVIPQLVEQFRTGVLPGVEAQALADAADAFGRGDVPHLPEQESTEVEPVETPVTATRTDPELLDIYVKEAAEHLAAIDQFLAEYYSDGVRYASEPLVRALHTLKGSSQTAGVLEAAGIAEVLERYGKALQTAHQPLSNEGIAVLEESRDVVEGVLAHLNDPSSPLPPTRDLQSRAEALYASVSHLERPVRPDLNLWMEPEDTESTQSFASSSSDDESVPDNDQAKGEAPVRAEEKAPEPVVQVANTGEDEQDAELLDLFLEEGREILDRSEQILQSWLESPGDPSLVQSLQRELHTLKGSARMAGVAAVGNLSHALESAFDALVEGRTKVFPELLEAIQQAHDRLSSMLEQVWEHRPISPAEELTSQITELLRTPEVPAESTATAPEVVFEEPAADATGIMTETAETQEAEAEQDVYSQAMQLAERFGADLKNWQDAPADIERHTSLAGTGARLEQLARETGSHNLADIVAVAGIVLSEVRDGHVPVSDELFGLMQLVHERLLVLVEQQYLGLPLHRVQDLIDSLKELIARHAEKDDEKTDTVTDDNRRQSPRIQHEMVRVRRDLMDNLVNYAGEVSIYRSRIEQRLNSFGFSISELDETVDRLRRQLRQFDIETEAQISARYQEAGEEYEDFDPLEFDRFTNMQQLSRAMMESLSDISSIEKMMTEIERESETLLLQQARVNTELQENLMQTRMVPLVDNAPRLRRIVRQTASELGHKANLSFQGAEVEMDRRVVERLVAPLEHMLRNAVVHGIESPEERQAAGKDEIGSITIALAREGAEVVVRISDDGRGIDADAVRGKAIERGLMKANADLADHEVMQFILESGFSTAAALTQVAGRGIGMDVVSSEIRQLSGSMDIDSVKGEGTRFTVRLPLSLSVSRALIVLVGEQTFAVPLLSVQGIARAAPAELEALMQQEHPIYTWLGEGYEVMHPRQAIGINEPVTAAETKMQSLLLAQSGEHRIALVVDRIEGSREIVVKSLGPQLSTLQSLSGATILADGSVALVLELSALIRRGIAHRHAAKQQPATSVPPVTSVPTVMVVDDSITVRAVTKRLLKRHGMKAVAARDGVDALTILEETIPDVMLLDIEMPRMDGFELATHIRNSETLKGIPIIMITSRTGEKHRQRAKDIGVNRYMGKPYSEGDLMENIKSLIGDVE